MRRIPAPMEDSPVMTSKPISPVLRQWVPAHSSALNLDATESTSTTRTF
jgi:hypothetical protein